MSFHCFLVHEYKMCTEIFIELSVIPEGSEEIAVVLPEISARDPEMVLLRAQ